MDGYFANHERLTEGRGGGGGGGGGLVHLPVILCDYIMIYLPSGGSKWAHKSVF